jgi:hypothetical protein
VINRIRGVVELLGKRDDERINVIDTVPAATGCTIDR